LFIGREFFDFQPKLLILFFSCGRTARLGRLGNALLMLLPNEAAYVNFLLNSQKVPLNEMMPPDINTIENVVPIVRQLAMSDK
jgi:ATP-dependent RNA helicase DDX55/SPB4